MITRLRVAGLALILAAGAAALAAPDELGHPFYRSFPPGSSGIAHLCQAVTQDAAGFIYIGNETSIRCYDGSTWRMIRLPTESGGVRQFTRSAAGTIYVGGAGVLGVLQGSGETCRFVSMIDLLPPAERDFEDVYDVLAAGDTVCFATEQKLLVWRDGSFTVIPCPTPAHSRGARLHRVGDTIYVTAPGHPLRRLAGDRLETVADDPVFRRNQMVAVTSGAADSLTLLTAGQGFFQLAGGRVTPLAIEANRHLTGRTIHRALRLADGSLVVSFTSPSGDGGMRFDPAGRYVGPIDQFIGLYVKTLRNFFQDREGGLWIATETGLFRLEWPSAVTRFDAVNGLGQGAVTDLVRHHDRFHAATTEGLYRLNASAAATGVSARFERILDQPVFSVISHSEGLVAMGYADLLAQSPAGFIPVAGLPAGGGSLHRSRRNPDRVWIATTQGIQSVRHTAAGWNDEGLLPGFGESSRAVAETADGALWVSGSDGGLFRLEFDGGKTRAPRVTRFTRGAGLPAMAGGAARFVLRAGEPVFLFGGVPAAYRFDPARNRLAAIPGTESWPQDVSAVLAAPGAADSTQLWFASPAGIHRTNPEAGPLQPLPQLVTVITGEVSSLVEETGPAGRVLWIGGSKGLARVEIDGAFPTPDPFPTVLTAAGVREGDRLAPGHPALVFNFVALRHQLAQSVSYQTRLIGFDRDWSAWSSARTRSFTSLAAGDYRFEVRARDADDRLSLPAALAFAVLPPWWLTGWAYLGYTAAAAGCLAGLVRLRTNSLHRRAARLEALVAERTAELGRQNTELVRLNRLELDEKVSARLAEEKARLEVLRYQLNPHFLFNTLASISSSLPADATTARSMVARLADFCRLTLHRPEGRDWTTLGEEIELLRTYLGIEQSRWGELLDVAIDCDPTLAHEPLPHFLLLPLVENALKYGRATSPDRVGLRLAARRTDAGGLVLEVANTGEWIEPADRKSVPSLGIGLDNLRERLVRHYPRRHRFAITHTDGWVTVVLHLHHPPAV